METYAQYAAQLAPQGLPMFGHTTYPLPDVARPCGHGFDGPEPTKRDLSPLAARIAKYRPHLHGFGWLSVADMADRTEYQLTTDCIRSAMIRLEKTKHVSKRVHNGTVRYKWIGD